MLMDAWSYIRLTRLERPAHRPVIDQRPRPPAQAARMASERDVAAATSAGDLLLGDEPRKFPPLGVREDAGCGASRMPSLVFLFFSGFSGA